MPTLDSESIKKVRILIPDTDEQEPLFPDTSIQTFLDMEGSDIDLAVARALETIAGDNMLIFRVNVRSNDGSVTASETTKLMLQRASQYRERAENSSVGFSILGGEEWLSQA